MEKMTKKELFGETIKIVERADIDVELKDAIVERLNKEIELANKKRSGETAKQKANKGLAEVVFNALAEAGRKMTATEIFGITKSDEITSAQKVVALIKVLGDRVVKTHDKKVTYFEVAEDVE